MEKILVVEKLCKDEILHDISFSIAKGEMVAVMGPSGSGKSTLLYNLSGMDKPTGGKVWLQKQEMTALSENEKSKIRLNQIGFVFQQMNMMENLNLLDNILLPAVYAKKMCKKERKGKKNKRTLLSSSLVANQSTNLRRKEIHTKSNIATPPELVGSRYLLPARHQRGSIRRFGTISTPAKGTLLKMLRLPKCLRLLSKFVSSTTLSLLKPTETKESTGTAS